MADFVDAIKYHAVFTFGRLCLHIHRFNEVDLVFRVEEVPAAFVGVVVVLL